MQVQAKKTKKPRRWAASRLVGWRRGRLRGARISASAGGHQAAEFADGVRLDLTDALRRHSVFVSELMQGRFFLDHPATLKDVAAAGVQASECRLQAVRRIGFPLVFLDCLGRV